MLLKLADRIVNLLLTGVHGVPSNDARRPWRPVSAAAAAAAAAGATSLCNTIRHFPAGRATSVRYVP